MNLTSMASLVTSSGGQPWVSVIILPSLLLVDEPSQFGSAKNFSVIVPPLLISFENPLEERRFNSGQISV